MSAAVVTSPCRKAVALAFLLLASAMLLAGTASATFPGENGKIVGSGPGFGGQDVYTVRPDGSGFTNLTVSPSWDAEPAWSADGRRIAFARAENSVFPTSIHVMNADGTGLEQVTFSSARMPAWSPDGTKIAFVNYFQGSGTIEIADADEFLEPVELVNGNSPSWSPDGSKIVYAKGGDIYAVEPDGENESQLTEGSALDENPDWSPDGSKILFSRSSGDGWQPHAMDADGSDETPVGGQASGAYRTRFSPDGTKLLLESGVVDLDGSNLVPRHPDISPRDWQPLSAGQLPPTASFTSSRSVALTDQVVQFTSTSLPGDGTISAQRWDLDGDGQFDNAEGPTASTSFGTPTTYRVRLSVENSQGARDAIATSILVVAPPETTFVSGPGTTQSATPTFAFSSAAGNSFECSLDGAGFKPCGSTYTTPRLVDGGHSLSVRAKDQHGFVDPTPAVRAFVVDTLPETTVLSVPSPTSSRAVFTFTADQPASFECRLDGGRWVPCTSPWTYSGLADGSHSFEVAAIDSTGNEDLSPAVVFWSIDATAPQLRLKARKRQNAVAGRGIAVAAVCPAEACTLRGKGAIAIGAKLVRLKAARGAAMSGGRASLKLALRGKKLKLVRTALAAGRKLEAELEVSAEDALGNVTEQEVSVQLLGAKPRGRR